MDSSIKRTPFAALSRPIAGTVGSTLLVTLPGSPKAVKENMAALLDAGVIPHAIELIKGGSGKQVHRELGVHDRQKVSLGLPNAVALVQEEPTLQHSHHRHHHHHHYHGHEIPTPKSHDPSLGGCPSPCLSDAAYLTFWMD
jgi:gephyrin